MSHLTEKGSKLKWVSTYKCVCIEGTIKLIPGKYTIKIDYLSINEFMDYLDQLEVNTTDSFFSKKPFFCVTAKKSEDSDKKYPELNNQKGLKLVGRRDNNKTCYQKTELVYLGKDIKIENNPSKVVIEQSDSKKVELDYFEPATTILKIKNCVLTFSFEAPKKIASIIIPDQQVIPDLIIGHVCSGSPKLCPSCWGLVSSKSLLKKHRADHLGRRSRLAENQLCIGESGIPEDRCQHCRLLSVIDGECRKEAEFGYFRTKEELYLHLVEKHSPKFKNLEDYPEKFRKIKDIKPIKKSKNNQNENENQNQEDKGVLC